jgi:hypothetical protein
MEVDDKGSRKRSGSGPGNLFPAGRPQEGSGRRSKGVGEPFEDSLFVEQSQLSVRHHPGSDQHRTEWDHQDFLGGCSRTSASDAGRQRLRDEFRGDAGVEVVVRLPVRSGGHGHFGNCALPPLQEEGLVVG